MKVEILDEHQKNLSSEYPSSSWLSSQRNVEHFLLWNTFYRKNIHRFASDYLGLKLYFYQYIILYLMGISNFIVIVAARAAAKSFIIAIYACCKAILYPNSQIVLTSGTRGQSKLIVTEKIQHELMARSPNLRREIDKIVNNQNEVLVVFKNGSTICTVTCNDNARGHRSTVNIGEEAREIDKQIMDTVISPFQIVRQAPFFMLPYYADNPIFQEEPTEIFISSSIEETHWLYKVSKTARDGMFAGDGSFFVAFDYSITLKHGIRTRRQLERERKKIDPITWKIEYENLVLRSNANAFYTYDLVKSNQALKRAFYPRNNADVINKVKNKFAIPKQDGEIRVISCDIAAIDRTINDNSVFTCLRLFEESTSVEGRIEKSFKMQVPYLEGIRGSEITKQAIRIRQVYDDFDADYIVLDVRNVGVGIYDALAKVLFDDERGVEYEPLKCMNDDVIAERIINPSAQPIIYCISASAKLNSEMAVSLRAAFLEHKIDLLVPKDVGIDELHKCFPKDVSLDNPDDQMFFEKPYFETMLLMNELINLEYEKGENTGLIRVREQPGMMKDRYSSLAMGNLFADKLKRDLIGSQDEFDFDTVPSCVSTVKF